MATEPPTIQPSKETDATIPASAEALLTTTGAVPGLIRLPAGIELNEAQARSMESERPVRLIVLAGAVDCGKTTLLTSLYELFQTAPIEKKMFAGCDTLPAFEKKCHLGRTDSGNDEEDTGRNTYEGPHPEYVHLKLQNGPKALGQIDFLITDVSGEMFEHARNSTDECKKLTFLRRAVHILVFLDCEKLFQPTKRWGMVKDATSLIQSCLDSEMFEPDCFVTVVWAKVDFVEAAKEKEKNAAKVLMQQAEKEFKTRFDHRIKNLKFHQIAARPKRYPKLTFGYGVGELLEDWVTKYPQGRTVASESTSVSVDQDEEEQVETNHQATSTQ
ncbi:MAG TPA: hypothetical protein VGO67_04955 [Verrucomicrobiae bacterium]|jgi:hypothetical protein